MDIKHAETGHAEAASSMPQTEATLATTDLVPAVFWHSDPIRPGEVMLVTGTNWGESPLVELVSLQDGVAGQPVADVPWVAERRAVVKPLQVSNRCVKFLIPDDWKVGVYAFQVDSGSGKSAPVLVNAPDPWWQQGDWGREASPSGWLRVFGKCLSLDDQASVSLCGPSGTLNLKPSKQDQWSLYIELPADMAAGSYQTWVHNGYGGPSGWKLVGEVTIRPHQPVWKSDVFDVRDYGAVASDHFDDTAAIQAALDAAGANGGGIVKLPRGRFHVNDTLHIPRCVLLHGEGADMTQLYFRDRSMPLEVLIKGTNSFGIEDLSIFAFNHLGGIASGPETAPDAGNVFIRRVNLRLNRFEQVNEALSGEASRRLLQAGWYGTPGGSGVYACGENVQITDCEIYSSYSPFTIKGRYMLFSGNNCFQGGTAHFIGGTEVIFENNIVRGGLMARGGADYARRHLYYAYNRMGSMSLHDAEIFTTDGGATQPVKVLAVDGRRLTLEEPLDWQRWTNKGTREIAVFVTQGTGAGQYRFLLSSDGNVVTMDRPWDVMPDENSTLIICPYYSCNLLVGNHFHDGTIVQNYCWGMEWVFAANRCCRTGGIHSAGRGRIPNWYSQYFENEILAGNGARGPWNQQPPEEAHLQVIGDSAAGAVFRRNILHNNARLETSQGVHDVVMDYNIVRNSEAGISIGQGADGIVLWRNSFERVTRPLVGITDRVYVHPAERLLADLAAEGLVPAALQGNSGWVSATKRLEELCACEPCDAQLDLAVQTCRLDLMRAAADSLPEGQPLALVQALTGLGIGEDTSADMQAVLARGTGGSATTTLLLSLPTWSVPAKVSISLGELPGWRSEVVAPVELTPGGTVAVDAALTVPSGVWGKPTIPVKCLVSGLGWEMQGVGNFRLGAASTADYISQWMVVGPFRTDRPGVIGEAVYPPERRFDLNLEYQGIDGPVRWQAIELTTAPYALDLSSLYGSPEKGVAFGAACIRVARPTTVAITTNPPNGTAGHGMITYLDKELLGVPARYGNLRVSRTLAAGDHILLCGSALSKNGWSLGVQVEVDPTAAPGDVRVLTAEEFRQAAALGARRCPIPEGRDLPFSDGYDWQLAFDDDFDRARMGTEWVAYNPEEWYESNSWYLKDGKLNTRGVSYWEYITCNAAFTPPIRVEADIIGNPERLDDWFQAITLTPRNQVGMRKLWGNVAGAGYMLAIGWDRNPNSAELWREEKPVQKNLNSPTLQAGRTRHIIAQFSPKRILLVVDGEVSLDYTDPEWLEGLDAVSLMNGFGRDSFDNVRIYTVRQ